MAEYNENESKMVETYTIIKSKLTTYLGVIITIIGVFVIFFVAALEGSKEVKASKSDNAKIITIWREANETEDGFPREQAELVNYKDKEYYFIVDEYIEGTNEVLKWHFSYDGGIDYIFKDYKFYVLTGLTFAISLYVSYINYVSTIKKVMNTEGFISTQRYYKRKKDKINPYTQYLPSFCIFKNQESYESEKRDIIEDAGINYKDFIDGKLTKPLEKWQVKKLKQIRRIKIDKIHSKDLLQEHNKKGKRVRMLPIGQDEHLKRFMVFGGFQKFISIALSGLVVAFGVVLGNWYLGLVYSTFILISAFSSIVIALDYGTTTYKNRFISKSDYLIEFFNTKDRYITIQSEIPEKDFEEDNEEKEIYEDEGGESNGNKLNERV